MPLRLVLALWLGALANAASAAAFDGCTKAQQVVIHEAIIGAQEITFTALFAVEDTPNFRRWYAYWTPEGSRQVRGALKSVYHVIDRGLITARCPKQGEPGCREAGTYASVWPHKPYQINFCPTFFDQPAFYDFPPGHWQMENGSREGTVIHEVSHFVNTAGTDDWCYGRSTCAAKAQGNPGRALNNADSLQYFAEDAMSDL